MIELYAFPDIEAAMVAYVSSRLGDLGDTATVATRMPNPRSSRHVRIVRAGGVQINLAQESPRLVLECWDTSEPEAAALLRRVRAIVRASAGLFLTPEVWCDKSTEVGVAFSPDLDTGTPRYLLTVELTVRGQVIN